MTESLQTAPAAYLLSEIVAHLQCARTQMTERDDRIICEHIVAAHELAKALSAKP